MTYDPYNGPEDRYLDSMMEDRMSGYTDWYEDLDGYSADDEDRDEDDEEGDE